MKGIDLIISNINTELSSLDWLEKTYGRAFLHETRLPNSPVQKVPKCFDNGDYINVLPNDNFISQSFIAVRTPEKWDGFNRDTYNFKTRELSIIFWANLDKINKGDGYYISDLKFEVEQVLFSIPEIASINAVYDEKVEDIFKDYTINNIDSQYLMYPFAGLRFDITVKYNETLC